MNISDKFTGFYEDDINGKKILIEYKNGKKDGIARYFNKNNQLELEIEYKEDMIDGSLTVYNEFGDIIMEANYLNGVLNGDMTTYYSNGMTQCKSHYKAGYQDGKSITYDAFGDISTKSMWKDGKKTGVEQIYYSKSLGGNIYSITEYVDGKRHGKQIQYEQDGKILSITTYKFGRAQEYPRTLEC